MTRFRAFIPTIAAAVVALSGAVQVVGGMAQVLHLDHYLRAQTESVSYLDVAPGVQAEGLVLVLLGAVLMALGKGLVERRRRVYLATLVVLSLIVLSGLWQGVTLRTTVLPLVLLAMLALVNRQFEFRPGRRRFTYSEIVAASSVLLALTFGVVGSYVLRSDFNGIETWTDAAYFTVVTFSTLGFGDILPTTVNAKIFTIFLVVVGLASFATALTVIAGPFLEERIKGVVSVMSKFQKTANHVVICGYSNVAESVIDELRERDVPFVVIESRDEIAGELRGKGVDVLTGDPTSRAILDAANLSHAAAVIAATDSDADNTLIAITAHELREADVTKDFHIVVRVEHEENVAKVQRLGADEVISPSTLAGRLMASKAIGDE